MDLIKFLNDRGIEYKKAGKNIGGNWIGIETCLFCNSGGNHFGINIKNGSFNCWICSSKGDFIKLIRETDKLSFKKAKEVAKKYGYESTFEREGEPKQKIENILPKEASDNFMKLHLSWLESRNFNPHYLIKKYKLKATGPTGKYRHKIIAPAIIDRQIVNFVAADVTGKAKSKYLFPANAEVNLTIGQCLYNYDSLKEGGEAILVEGITDVWRLGDKSVAMLHKRITKEQLNLLARKELERVTIVPDEGAEDAGEYNAEQISGIIDNVEVISLPAGDPGDLTVDEVADLREFIGI